MASHDDLHPFRDDSDSEVDFNDDSDEDWPAPRSRSRSTSSSSTSSQEAGPSLRPDVNMRGDGGRGRGRGGKRRRVDTSTSNDWKWKNVTDSDFQTVFLPNFDQGSSGVQVNTTNFSPIDYFNLYFPEEAVDCIIQETNRYAEAHQAESTYSEHSRKKDWNPVDKIEVLAFIGIQMAMGMCVKPSGPDYWDKSFWINKTDYGKVMSRNRYQIILGFLHFNDNTLRVERGNEGYNPLFKIQPLLDIVLPTFMEYFNPGQNLSIDESMVKFKGRVHMKQYLPAKPTKWGFKVFVLADSDSHYCLRAKLYTGKDEATTTDNTSGFSGRVVKELLQGLEGKGHIIFTDSYYTSPLLYKDLKEAGIGACGTVIDNRKQFPSELKAKNLKLKKGDLPVFYATDDNEMLAVSWFDSTRVNLISTVDNNNTFQKRVRQRGHPAGRQIQKPTLVENYNKHMGAVDHFDQVSVSYPYPHRSYKWYLPLYHFLLESAIMNAHILYKANSPQNKMSAKKFRQEICLRLIEKQTLRRKALTTAPSVPSNRLLTDCHFMDKYTRPRYKPDCAVCKAAGKRSQTCMYCPDCNVPLCMLPCFKIYHTVDNYGAYRRRQLQPTTPSPSPSTSRQ